MPSHFFNEYIGQQMPFRPVPRFDLTDVLDPELPQAMDTDDQGWTWLNPTVTMVSSSSGTGSLAL